MPTDPRITDALASAQERVRLRDAIVAATCTSPQIILTAPAQLFILEAAKNKFELRGMKLGRGRMVR